MEDVGTIESTQTTTETPSSQPGELIGSTTGVSTDDVVAERLNVPATSERPLTAKPFTKEYLEQIHDPAKRPEPVAQLVRFDPGTYFNDPKSSHDDFLTNLHGALGVERYTALMAHVAGAYRDQFVDHYGLAPSHVDPALVEAVREDLRGVLPYLRPEVLEGLQWMTDDARDKVLESFKQQQEMAQEIERRDYQERERQVTESASRQHQWLLSVAAENESQHTRSLENWEPFGQEAKENQQWRDRLVNLALGKATSNPQMSQMLQDAINMAQLVGVLRLQGDERGAQALEAEIMEMAKEWNGRFANILTVHRKQFEPIIKDALAWRAHQKEQEEAAKRAPYFKDFKVQTQGGSS